MVTELLLTEKMQNDGRSFVAALDDAKLNIKGALWFYYTDAEEWRFVIATSDFDSTGPKHVYQQVQRILKRRKGEFDSITLPIVTAISSKHPLITLLSHAIRTGEETSGVRFSRSTINGNFVEDAYVYRLKK